MRSILFAAAAGALLSSPALAAETSTATAAKSDAKEKLVCRAVDVTSTRIARKKACMTKAQWKQLAEDQSERMRRQQNKDGLGDGANSPNRGF